WIEAVAGGSTLTKAEPVFTFVERAAIASAAFHALPQWCSTGVRKIFRLVVSRARPTRVRAGSERRPEPERRRAGIGSAAHLRSAVGSTARRRAAPRVARRTTHVQRGGSRVDPLRLSAVHASAGPAPHESSGRDPCGARATPRPERPRERARPHRAHALR